jgi:PST family polysaccharide transporter
MSPPPSVAPEESQPGSKYAVAAAAPYGQLSQRAIHGFLWVLSTSGAQGVLQVAILIVLARLLGPTAFGIIGAALLVMRLADIVGNLGVGQALVQRKHLAAHHIASAQLFFTFWGALLTAVLVATAALQADLLRIPELRRIIPVMAIGLLVSNMAEVALALLRRDLRFRVIAITQAASYAFAYGIVGVGLAALGFGLWSLVWAFVSQLTLRSIVFLIVRRHPWLTRSGLTGLRDLLVFGSGMTGCRVAMKCAQELDNLVVARMLGAEPLGLYRRAYQLSVAPALFLSLSVSTVLFPAVTKLHEPQRLGRAYLRGIAGAMLLGLPAGAFLAVVAPEAIAVLFGAQWMAAAAPLAILSLGLVFQLSQQVAVSIAAATGAVFATAWRQGIYALAVLVGALLGQPWGLVGVATGVLAALLVNYALMSQLIIKLTGLRRLPLFRAHVGAALLTVATAGSASLVRWASIQIGLAPPVVLMVCATTTVAATVVLVRTCPQHLLGVEGLWLVERVLDTLPERHARRIRGMLGFTRALAV